jgi:hypothetical protein
MRKLLIIFAIISFVFAGSCKKRIFEPDDCFSYDYRDCETWEPYLSLCSFKFTINDQVQNVPFIIYKGKMEDGDVLFYDTARGEDIVYYDLNFGYYSVRAEYKYNGKTVYAVDGGELEKWSQNICDSVCWGWDSLHLDVRLK